MIIIANNRISINYLFALRLVDNYLFTLRVLLLVVGQNYLFTFRLLLVVWGQISFCLSVAPCCWFTIIFLPCGCYLWFGDNYLFTLRLGDDYLAVTAKGFGVQLTWRLLLVVGEQLFFCYSTEYCSDFPESLKR